MLKQRLMEKQDRTPRKAVAPDRGAAAFSVSTAFQMVQVLWPFPGISRHEHEKSNAVGNLLPEKHYFRLGRAGGPFPNVVLTEGQRKSLLSTQEVAE